MTEPGTVSYLERESQLAALAEELAVVRAAGEGRLVLVTGEAGVGKTSLLRHFCDALDGPRRTLWGACEPLLARAPLGPLLDIAAETGGELEQVVAGPARPHQVMAALAEELRRRRSSVVVIEDAHWADEATLDVLVMLGRRLASVPALLIVSFRDDELSSAHPLRMALGLVGAKPLRIRLPPLSMTAVAELAAPFGIDVEELYRRTGGNPFYVTEVLGEPGARIPATVRDAVLARAAALSPRAHRLLEAASIFPREADLRLLGEIVPQGLDHLDECLATGVITSDSRYARFRHELARIAIEDAIAPHHRADLHRRALDASTTPGTDADAARLAFHAQAAGDADAVMRWAPQAAERAGASGAHREAAEWYGVSLRFAAAAPSPLRAELLTRRAHECYMTSEFDEAIAAERAALECYRRLGDRRGEGNSVRALARQLFFAGHTAEGERLMFEAVEILEQLDPGHELAMAYGNVSQRLMVIEEESGATEWGERAVALAQTLGDTEALVYALTNLGAAKLQGGDETGEADLDRAMALAREHGLDEYAGRVFLQLTLRRLRQWSLERSARHCSEGIGFCEDRGLETWRLYLLAARARIELARGGWDQAADAAGLVLHHPRSAPVARGWAVTVLGTIRARRGDPQATAALDEAHAIVADTGEIERIGHVAAARAEAAWLSGGDARRIAADTDRALALALERENGWIAGELAVWRQRAGLAPGVAPARAAGPFGRSLRGDWRGAADEWERLGCPYDAALALADSDDPDQLRDAHARLGALDASAAAAAVLRRLRSLGVRGVPRGPRRRTRGNPAGLTDRELEVLVLLAEGLRNAEIAERLVVSVKTVDHHVSAVLRKLDARSRSEAGLQAIRLGLAPPSAKDG